MTIEYELQFQCGKNRDWFRLGRYPDLKSAADGRRCFKKANKAKDCRIVRIETETKEFVEKNIFGL